jgi:dTDP-4-amino-4,6-dideoxygalactose transaminase
MDGIQAAVLSVKLRHLQAGNDRRRAHAVLYNELLADLPLVTPVEAAGNHHVYHIYPVRVAERDRVLQSMGAAGIGCGIHYPVPVHLQEAYRFLGHGSGAFPVSEQCAGELLSLPMYPELTPDQVRLVAGELKGCLTGAKSDVCAV